MLEARSGTKFQLFPFFYLVGPLLGLTRNLGARQQDWVDRLELDEFCYNSKHSATGSTPFQMVMGKSPIVPVTWAAHGQTPSDASEEVPMVT